MPGDLSSQGDNPFFLGYREQDPTTGAALPAPKGNKRAISDVIWSMARKMDPTLTRHDRDLLSHRMDTEGLTEQFGKPDFAAKLNVMVNQISGAPGRVVSKYISSKRATEDGNPSNQ